MKKKLPKYFNGGDFLQKTGQVYKNAGIGTADAALTTLGMSNIIKDDAYQGAGADMGKGYANVVGGIGKAALPMAANMIMPGTGSLVSAGQQGIGQLNPQDPNQEYNQSKQIGNAMGNLTPMIGQAIMAMGGKMCYPNGGTIPNAEVEKQENTLNPDGSTTQFDGPSHDNGGIKTKLAPETLIFSDRLKLGKKTFAELNKVNNTKKEDKMLNNPKSPIERLTAELMKTAKNKNSEALYNEQEALKQSKLNNYAKRIGLSMEGKYPKGGKTPAQWNQEMLAKGWQVDPRKNMGTIQGQYPAYYDPATVKLIPNTEDSTGYNVTGLAPDNSNYAQYTAPLKTSNIDFKNEKDWIPVGTTNINGQTAGTFRKGNTNSQDRYIYQGGQYTKFTNGGWVPPTDEGIEIPEEFSGYTRDTTLPTVDMNTFNNGTSLGNTGDRMDAMNTNPIDGGRIVPDVDRGMYLTDRSGMPNLGDGRMDAMLDDSQGAGVPWGNIAKQVGLGLANNMGNIYDLNRAKDTEVTNYNRVNPSFVDPTAALNYNSMQGRKMNEELRNSSVGNSSTYIQNRKDAAINQMMSNDQIRQQYANTNANIANQGKYYNAGIGDKETETNMMNRAAGRNIKSNAYANIGQNIMGQYGDYKRGEVDQQKVNMLGQYYNDPNFQKIVEEYKRSNNIK